LLIFVLLLVTACSSSDIIEVEADVGKCFLIMEKDTNLPVTNTEIFIESDFGCESGYSGGGCGYIWLTAGKSDNNGEVCTALCLSGFEAVERVSCLWNNSKFHFALFDPSSKIGVIYVDTYFLSLF
jgi:hypothetical protein